jgi:hypothetical protein
LNVPGLALVDVDGHQPRRRFGCDQLPLAPGREARPAKAAQTGILHQRDDLCCRAPPLDTRRRQRVPAGCPVRRVVDVPRRHGAEVRLQMRFVGARVRDVSAFDDLRHALGGRVWNGILPDHGDRRCFAAADARRMEHPHLRAEHRRQLLHQVVRSGELARNRVADAHRDCRGRRLAFLDDVEVVIEGGDLVDLRQCHLQLRRQGDEMRRS